MIVGLCEITLRLRHVRSLKEKRGVVRRVTERTRTKHLVAIAETGALDDKTRALIGFAIVGNDTRNIDSRIDAVVLYIRELYLAEVIHVEREAFNWTEEERGGGLDHLMWE